MTDHLERALEAFVDHAMTGQYDEARRAFADAQAHDVQDRTRPAQTWAAIERQHAQQLPDDLDVQQAEAALRRLNRKGPT